jgi:hypothetical protein
MFFGEYLVNKGAISAQDLVLALIDQMKSAPNIAQVALDKEILSADEIMKVFGIQQRQGLSFGQSLLTLGPEYREKLHQLEKLVEETRIPLGQVLLKRSVVDLKVLTMNLDEYLSIVSKDAPVLSNEEAGAQSKEEESASEGVSPLGEGDDLTYPDGMLAELEDLFDERKYKAIKVALSFYERKKSS